MRAFHRCPRKPIVAHILALSSAAGRLDSRHIDLFHLHHRVECAWRPPDRDPWLPSSEQAGYLPGQALFVLAAHALLAAIADDGIPVAIRFGLVGGCNLELEGLVVLECRSAMEADAGIQNKLSFCFAHSSNERRLYS